MSHRPNFIDTRLDSRQSPVPDLPSPRAGEVPPALSPLDALALQGRLLAKKFEEEERQGRRISRLPALTIQNEFGRSRPGYFRSISADTRSTSDDAASMELREEDTTSRAKETIPEARPKSHYPFIQMEEASPPPRDVFRNNLSPLGEDESQSHSPNDYFAFPRTSSPDHLESRQQPRAKPSREGPPASYPDPKYPSNDASRTLRPYQPRTMAPQRSPIPQRSPPRASPSIRSVPGDSSDDIDGMSLGGSLDSLPPRQFSNTTYSRSHSPASPPSAAIPRSPSISSEYSTGGSRLSRPAYNFSRPLSTQHSFDSRSWVDSSPRPSDDRPTMGTPTRQDSEDSSLVPHDVHTPVSMTSDEYVASQEPESQPATSYIYAKYSLPRGRAVDRESMDALKFMNQFFKDDAALPIGKRPPSPPSPTQPMNSSPQTSGTLSTDFTLPIRGSSLDYSGPRPRLPSIPSSATDSSSSTIRPRTTQSIADMSAEEHLDEGIKCHESGSLQKSTYHLRLAARAGHPTGMLLYALACRHGWGMRQNEAEGFNWLKKAVDSAQLEIAEDEDRTKKGRALDLLERKTHKAQFALGIYELGKSYMEGWGVHQDKALALRCFEIAGNWGDADALTEAGYCYAQGQGCKKDLKKAARFYRLAESKGASMIGQSW
jgi:TPR repeat protein